MMAAGLKKEAKKVSMSRVEGCLSGEVRRIDAE